MVRQSWGRQDEASECRRTDAESREKSDVGRSKDFPMSIRIAPSPDAFLSNATAAA
jgi:hypothetical protein